MSGSVLFHIAFGAVVIMILLTVWAAMVFEAGEDPPGRQQEIRGTGHREAIDQKGTPS
jgi:hypothetical protein